MNVLVLKEQFSCIANDREKEYISLRIYSPKLFIMNIILYEIQPV